MSNRLYDAGTMRTASEFLLPFLLTVAALDTQGPAPKPAEPSVAAANRAVLSQLPFADRQDFEDATRGFIGTRTNAADLALYDFLKQDAPPSANPSLWRQAQLNAIHGLFRVTDGIYQLRGLSLANMTIVEGATGLIVIVCRCSGTCISTCTTSPCA